MSKSLIPIIIFSSLIIWGCKNQTEEKSKTVEKKTYSTPVINYSLHGSFPHDTNAFTEGFLIHNGEFYESTGAMEGLSQTRSLFGILDTTTGVIYTKVELDRNKYFGEGIVFLHDKIYQLTYKSKTGFVYDANTFDKLQEFTIPSKEGWGMTTDGKSIIMSDGTNNLYFLDSETLRVNKTLPVSDNGYAKDFLNELEYINGYVYANIWGTTKIAKIDIETGIVQGEINLRSLAEDAYYTYNGSLEMNGIAYDSISETIFITGKMWPKVYKIKLH